MEKKKLLLLLLIIVSGRIAVVAQNETTASASSINDKYSILTNTFWNNWFISAEGGANIYFGDYDRYASFGKRLAPTFGIAVGKWFTPGIGVRVMLDYVKQKGATKNCSGYYTHVGNAFTDSHGETLYYQSFKYYYLHG